MDAVMRRLPLPTLVGVIVALIAAGLVALVVLGGNALPERHGPPVEEVAFERVGFDADGYIELRLRNTGPDPVTIGQVAVNDAYVDFTSDDDRIGVKGSRTFTLNFPWQEGLPYRITLLTATGVTIEHLVAAAVETPAASGGVLGLMALLGLYVGVVPVLLGMLLLPVLRRAGHAVTRWLLALTVGLLAFLAIDATLGGIELGNASGGVFGGAELVFLGAGLAFLVLVGVDRYLQARGRALAESTSAGSSRPWRLALMVAIGIGLHNLGEGLAIGSAYAIGELALGAFLVFGFALHNTTEGLAIVAPLSAGPDGEDGAEEAPGEKDGSLGRNGLWKLLGLGMIAGAPAILGAILGVSVTSDELAALLLGVGVGAIVQVIVQIVPALRDGLGRVFDVVTATGLIAGLLVMYLTGLLIVA